VSEQERLRHYLLGTLQEAETEEIETRLLMDEGLHERLELEQDALVEGHLRGTLAPSERAAFAARVEASPALREALAQARLLHERLAPPSPRPAAFSPWLALAAALLLGAAAWWWLAGAPSDPGSAAVPSTAPTVAPSAPPRGVPPTAAPAPPSSAVASLTLSRGQVMAGGEAESVVLGTAARLVVELVLEAPVTRRYAAELWSESGRSLWRAESLSANGQEGTVTADLPAGLFTPGRYRLELAPLTPEGRGGATPYYFEVRR
jgi:hypothetical protein